MRRISEEGRRTRIVQLGRSFAALCLLAAFGISALADEPAAKADRFERWLPAMRKFEEQDKEQLPESGGIVFVGSSSIRLWNLEKWFGDLKPTPLNRGFGGSQIADATHFAELLVLRHLPQTIVFYSGDNDIAAGVSAEQVEKDFAKFCEVIHNALPKTRIIFIAVKPSPSRWKFADVQRDANTRVDKLCNADERLYFLDVWPEMLDKEGQPRREFFREDMLHLNDSGYAVWASLLRPLLAP